MTKKPKAGIKAGQRAERRRALVEAAKIEFLAKGYAQTTVGDIIARSGGSRSTIYQEFGNKADLFVAVGTSYAGEMLDLLSKRLEDSSSNPRDTLLEYGRLYLDAALVPSAVQLMRCGLFEGQAFPELAQAVFRTYITASVEPIAAYLERLSAAKVIALESALEAAELFLVMVKGNLQTHAMAEIGFTVTRERLERQLVLAVDVFLDGVKIADVISI